jgi:hypothetical protein
MSRNPSSVRQAGPPRRRFSLFLLIIPVVLYALTPLVANSVEPRIAGLPFVITYTIVGHDPHLALRVDDCSRRHGTTAHDQSPNTFLLMSPSVRT